MKKKRNGIRIFTRVNRMVHQTDRKIISSGKPWQILACGFVAGIIATIGVQKIFIKEIKAPVELVPQANATTNTMSRLSKTGQDSEQLPSSALAPVFDFYTQLSRNRESHAYSKPVNGNGSGQPHNTTASTRNMTGKTEQKPEKREKKATYLLQAASLKTQASAESLKKEMKSWGLHSSIKSIRGTQGTWYRVQAGPFSSRERAEDANSLLALHGLKGLLIRR